MLLSFRVYSRIVVESDVVRCWLGLVDNAFWVYQRSFSTPGPCTT